MRILPSLLGKEVAAGSFSAWLGLAKGAGTHQAVAAVVFMAMGACCQRWRLPQLESALPCCRRSNHDAFKPTSPSSTPMRPNLQIQTPSSFHNSFLGGIERTNRCTP